MAAKVFFLFVAVLVLFEAEAGLYRRLFAGPESPFMRGKKQTVFINFNALFSWHKSYTTKFNKSNKESVKVVYRFKGK